MTIRVTWVWLRAWIGLALECVVCPYHTWTWPTARELRESWETTWYVETGERR
jgi:hypothetical protein